MRIALYFTRRFIQPSMNTNSSILRTRAKSPLWKGAALLTSLVIAASAQGKADTITNYDLVDDVIGNSYVSVTPSNYGLGPKLYETTQLASGSISGEFTAWEAAESSDNTTLFFKSKISPNIVSSTIVGTTLKNEKQFNFTRNGDATVSGVYTSANGTNGYARLRNFRIASQNVNFQGPLSLTYTNVSDNGSYSSIPQAYDVGTSAYGVGFSGNVSFQSAEGYNGGGINIPSERYKIHKVYLSLERTSDGAYWSGTGWSHLRVNHLASKQLLPGSQTNWKWSSVGIWPTGADLLSGQYRLRTMAAEETNPSNDGRTYFNVGKLDTITFTISSSSASYVRIRNRWASSMYMYDGGDVARYNTLQSSVYSQSPASFEWELLSAPNAVGVGYLTIKNHATGDILHVENLTGVVQCTNVPNFYTSSMWKQTDVDAGYKRFENRKQFGNFFRLGYSDGQVHYDPVPATDITAHWSLEPVSGSSAISSSAAASQSTPSGGAS